jgi:putative ABC transport system permease protein
MAIKLNTQNIASAIAAIKLEWNRLAPGQPFNYSFLDHKFTAMYRHEQRTGSLAVCFSMLAISIACLGLFGLTAYMANQRKKEIAIHKVLGADIGDVLMLFFKDYVKLLAVAFVIAVPLAWWGIHEWLNDFSYRISIGYDVFLIAGGLTMLVALSTVSFQAIKAASVNPIKSLKHE